jgi:hypothetical protein
MQHFMRFAQGKILKTDGLWGKILKDKDLWVEKRKPRLGAGAFLSLLVLF